MDYTIFNPEQTAREGGESEQAHMERVLRDACEKPPREALSEPGICDLLEPEFYACSAENQSVTLAVTVKPWMLNPKATLHGGMMATMLDMAMGLLARCCGAGMNVSTVGLSVSYLRPAAASEELLVTARVDKAGRRILFLSGDISRPDGKTVATATASFVP